MSMLMVIVKLTNPESSLHGIKKVIHGHYLNAGNYTINSIYTWTCYSKNIPVAENNHDTENDLYCIVLYFMSCMHLYNFIIWRSRIDR